MFIIKWEKREKTFVLSLSVVLFDIIQRQREREITIIKKWKMLYDKQGLLASASINI